MAIQESDIVIVIDMIKKINKSFNREIRTLARTNRSFRDNIDLKKK